MEADNGGPPHLTLCIETSDTIDVRWGDRLIYVHAQ